MPDGTENTTPMGEAKFISELTQGENDFSVRNGLEGYHSTFPPVQPMEVRVTPVPITPFEFGENIGATKDSILLEADGLVYGDRNADYGHPADDYDRTAAMWTALLSEKLAPGAEVTAEDAVRCMVALKLSRDVNLPKRDNRVDMAGYAECLHRIGRRREGLE